MDGQYSWRAAVGQGAAIVGTLLAAGPARADNLGAIGPALAALVVLALTAFLVIVVAIPAAVASRASAPPRRWKLPFAVVGLLLSVAGLVIAGMAASEHARGMWGDVVFFGVVPVLTAVLSLLACLRLLRFALSTTFGIRRHARRTGKE